MMRLRLPRFGRSAPFLYPGEELRPRRRRAHEAHLFLEGAAKRAVETGHIRMLVTAGLFAVAFLGVGLRLVDLMLFKAHDTTASRGGAAAVERTVARGDIVDRNGILLATNLPTVNLYVDGARVIDAEAAADKLVRVLPHLDRAEVLEKLTAGKRFLYIDRDLTPREQVAVNAAGIPGLYFEESERRAYLQGPTAAHVLGATDTDNNGIAGVELTFDDKLKQGETVRLALDIRVQHAARAALANAIKHFKAKAGTTIILDARNGEVVAMTSLPDYDPVAYGKAPDDARFNRATLGVYEMGSTFKLFNTAMALDSGRVRLTDTYDTTKPLRVARFTIRDHHPEDRWLSVPEILIHSSNIGSARMAAELGTDMQRDFLRKLGLLEPTSIELPEVGAPLYPQRWREINTMTISYGHGIAVTPLQQAAAVAALVNGGIMYAPTLLEAPAPEGTRVIKEETSRRMRQLMRLVVTEGTASKADVAGYLVGGKTGTAEKVAATGGYNRRSLRNTFAAAFPMDDPQYVVVTVLDEPKGLKSTFGFATAGWNVAPAAGSTIAAVAPLLGVKPRFAHEVETLSAGLPSQTAQIIPVAEGAHATR